MNTHKRMSVIAGVWGILVLTGCAGSPGVVDADSSPSEATSSPSPTKTSSPTPTPEAASDLSFDTGGAGVAGLGWGDPFMGDPAFTVLAPDDGNGSWSYTDNANGCTIFFYQGAVTDLDMSQSDRDISDAFLTIMLGARMDGVTREDVSANAFDDSIWQSDLASTVAVRTIWGRRPTKAPGWIPLA
jgi:hypothetical protein